MERATLKASGRQPALGRVDPRRNGSLRPLLSKLGEGIPGTHVRVTSRIDGRTHGQFQPEPSDTAEEGLYRLGGHGTDGGGGDGLWLSAPRGTVAPTDLSGLDDAELVQLAQGVEYGDPDAPVTIMEFGDYHCPTWGFFALQTKPQADLAYVESGQAKFV